jgi:hypothetical protein
MEIIKDILWLFPTERISVLEIYKKKKMVFYNYSYQVMDTGGNWHDRLVWHNFEQKPHYDIFDEAGKLIEQKEMPGANIKDIMKLVKIFRKNLMAMDLTKI